MCVGSGRPSEVILFSAGDSTDPDLWSNVPYCLAASLEECGVCVRRVNIAPPQKMERFYYRFISPLLRVVSPRTSFSLFRSHYQFDRAKKLAALAERKYPRAEWNIYTTFSYAFRSHPARGVALVSDWPYDYYLSYFEQRHPDMFEKASVAREKRQIADADVVVGLFPKSAEWMRAIRPVYYLGNVVNIVGSISRIETAENKQRGRRVLFVGGLKYLQGARMLAEAMTKVQQQGLMITCDIVGLTPDQLPGFEGVVRCHGYLSKGKEEERTNYYQLMRDASVFVNPSPRWAGFSATLEAMYFGTPVAVPRYEEFVRCFGENPPFGTYISAESVDALATIVTDILNRPNYAAMSNAAREAVAGSTWQAFAQRFMALLCECVARRQKSLR